MQKGDGHCCCYPNAISCVSCSRGLPATAAAQCLFVLGGVIPFWHGDHVGEMAWQTVTPYASSSPPAYIYMCTGHAACEGCGATTSQGGWLVGSPPPKSQDRPVVSWFPSNWDPPFMKIAGLEFLSSACARYSGRKVRRNAIHPQPRPTLGFRNQRGGDGIIAAVSPCQRAALDSTLLVTRPFPNFIPLLLFVL